MNSIVKRLAEAFAQKTRSGYAYPQASAVYDVPTISLADVVRLYERDPTCKASVDLLAASTCGMGFYTTVNDEYEKANEAKSIVDEFCETVNLDALLCDMARALVACGNDFWLKVTPDSLTRLQRLDVDAVEKTECSYLADDRLRIPFTVEGYKLRQNYGGSTLKPGALIHWRINCANSSGFGVGVLQVLLHSLAINSDSRPSYAWMKAKIERVMPKILEKYAGPDVLALLEKADGQTIQKFQSAIKNRSEEGTWLFYNGRGDIKPVTLDPRARFEYYIEHLINQFYLGCETPLPRLFSTPGFTEASAKAALDLQEMLVKPIQRYVKRQVEKDIFSVVLAQAGLESKKAQVRLNWGVQKTPQVVMADMLKAAELGLIRSEEFRKSAAKFGWELWQDSKGDGEK